MIWPKVTETWVLPHRPEMVCALMKLKVKPGFRQSIGEGENSGEHLFNGIVREESFSISRLIHRPDNFLPLINGEWVGSENGSLIRITFQLFGSTRMFLGFWTLVCLVGSLFLAYSYREYMLAASLLLVGLLNYWISLTNFKKRVQECRKTLQEVLA